jgi:hypothetical protein
VGKDFNTRSFVNINDFYSYREAIEFIIELDNNYEKYQAMATAPWFNDNRVPEEFSDESLLRFFDFIIEDSKSRKPVATSIRNKFTHRILLFVHKLKAYLYHRLGIVKGFR